MPDYNHKLHYLLPEKRNNNLRNNHTQLRCCIYGFKNTHTLYVVYRLAMIFNM